jgi:hypothetical protein
LMTIPSWTQLGVLLTTATSRVIYTLPIAGYVILYSDYFQKLFTFTSLNPSWGFLSFNERINMIYYGSWLLFVAFGLWWFFSPRLLRGKRDLQHFVSDIVVARDRSTVVSVAQSPPFTIDEKKVAAVLNDIDRLEFPVFASNLKSRGTALGDGAGEYEHRIPTALAFYFKWHNVTWPALRACITALAAAGYLLVIVLPSLDLFLKVFGTHYHRLFA